MKHIFYCTNCMEKHEKLLRLWPKLKIILICAPLEVHGLWTTCALDFVSGTLGEKTPSRIFFEFFLIVPYIACHLHLNFSVSAGVDTSFDLGSWLVATDSGFDS